MSYTRYLPPHLTPAHLAAAIGIVSDTHIPLRRKLLPTNLSDTLGGVDLLLHAGDVGELWVLDQLSALAPVIAVHGNDDTDDAQRELPYQQLITVAGRRILLWHSHCPDHNEEMAFRADDDLHRSMARSVARGRRAQADIVVFGHWHIPLVYRAEDLLVINPGALASGNEFTRMLLNSVALLLLEHSGQAHVLHIDLAAPQQPFDPAINWDAGFDIAMRRFAKSIIAPELAPAVHYLWQHMAYDEIMAARPFFAALATPLWDGDERLLTIADIDVALPHADLPPDLHARLTTLWRAWRTA